MAKTQPPETKQEPKAFADLSKEEKLAAFKDALSSEDFKDVNVAKELGLKVEPEGPSPEEIESKNQEIIKDTLPQYEELRAKLAEAGYKFEEAKMSEAEKHIHERLEKQAQAKFAEQCTEINKIDADFPVDVIEKMSINTDDKVTVMAALKEVAVRNSEATEKLKKELDTASAELKDAKLAAPEKPKEDKTGEEIVASAMSEINFKDPNANKPEEK